MIYTLETVLQETTSYVFGKTDLIQYNVTNQLFNNLNNFKWNSDY